jgi:hypothetical protein
LERLFQEEKFEVLNQIYQLYQPVENGCLLIQQKFKKFLLERGRSIIMQAEKTLEA